MRELDQKWGDGETVVEYAVTFWEEGIKYAVLPIREMAELTAAFLNLYAKARTNSEDNMMARLLNTVSQQLFDEEKGGEKGNHDGN